MDRHGYDVRIQLQYNGNGALLDIAVPRRVAHDQKFRDLLFRTVSEYAPESSFYRATEPTYVPHHFSAHGELRQTIMFGPIEQRISSDYFEYLGKKDRRKRRG